MEWREREVWREGQGPVGMLSAPHEKMQTWDGVRGCKTQSGLVLALIREIAGDFLPELLPLPPWGSHSQAEVAESEA